MDLTRETERLRAEGEGNSGSINEPRMRDGPQPEPTSRLASEWPDSSFQNLFHFGLGVLCLLVLFYGSKSFSFSVFHSQVNRFLTAVERGGTIVAGNIGIGTKISVEIAAEGLPSGAKRIAQRWVSPLGQTANGLSAEYRSGAEVIAELKKVPLAGRRSILSAGGEFSRLFSSFNLGLLKFGETGRDKTIEAWLLTGHSAGKYFGAVGDLSVATLEPVQTVGIGAIKGQQLAKSQFSASLTGISEFFLMGFKNAYSSARDTVVETNSRVVGIRSRVLANLNSWKNT
ncbi:MAG: hypothetical protein NTY66_03705, partial [Candidatus Vogelbacteria bacterium]|nr:hypothetical protein [Candidatus Vogelbacteria bacterium]